MNNLIVFKKMWILQYIEGESCCFFIILVNLYYSLTNKLIYRRKQHSVGNKNIVTTTTKTKTTTMTMQAVASSLLKVPS